MEDTCIHETELRAGLVVLVLPTALELVPPTVLEFADGFPYAAWMVGDAVVAMMVAPRTLVLS